MKWNWKWKSMKVGHNKKPKRMKGEKKSGKKRKKKLFCAPVSSLSICLSILPLQHSKYDWIKPDQTNSPAQHFDLSSACRRSGRQRARKGGGASNAAGIINYHLNFLFGTSLITNSHSYFRIWRLLMLLGAILGGNLETAPPKSIL